MIRLRTLVPYHTDEEKKKLEDYISERTGRNIDLGPIDYGGKLTLQTMDADFTNISSTQITYAGAFPGRHFRNVDEFIKWHSRISDMHYLEALNKVEDPMDVVALFYEETKHEISYICFRVFDRKDIERYLVSSDGNAMPFENKGNKYWLLLSEVNGNMVMFSKTDRSNIPFTHIRTDLQELEFFKYLISMNNGE